MNESSEEMGEEEEEEEEEELRRRRITTSKYRMEVARSFSLSLSVHFVELRKLKCKLFEQTFAIFMCLQRKVLSSWESGCLAKELT
jgi:hypothetical protein